MEETQKVQALKTLAAAKARRARTGSQRRLASVRVSPGGYLATASILTFASALLWRSDRELLALGFLAVAWSLIPALAFTDRLVFDGRWLSRQGVLPFISQLIFGQRQQLSVADFEKVATNAVRTLRRGGRVRYRYRSQISGKGITLAIVSGGKSYRQMVAELFPLIHPQKMDARTRDLRDHLCEARVLAGNIQQLRLASSTVLDNANSDLKERLANRRATADGLSPADLERAVLLRQLANRLRVAGRLRESQEAFRRALIVAPGDASLIYEFARLLRSRASANGDARLLSRARAALRLASARAGADSALLTLISESLIECGDVDRAERMLQRALRLGADNFRARVELADLALRNGKLAHVIHYYRDAAAVAPDKALGIFARREADYYARLNDDEQFLVTELRRINWLQNSTRVRRLAGRVTNASILAALAASYLDPTIGGLGWALASSALFAWIASLLVGKVLANRWTSRPAE
jgi:tetratricopeptide (TPR) repeat protein